MDRRQLERAADDIMEMTLSNLTRDGFVAFAALLVSKHSITPCMLERVGAEQKERLGVFLRALASTGQYDAIAIVSEAWTLDPLLNTSESDPLNVPVSEHPNRKEGVFVQLSSSHGDLLVTAHFDRDNNGHPIHPRHVCMAWQPLEGFVTCNFARLFARA